MPHPPQWIPGARHVRLGSHFLGLLPSASGSKQEEWVTVSSFIVFDMFVCLLFFENSGRDRYNVQAGAPALFSS